MAIHNDPRMYSGGNVVFNPNPHVQLYANLLARQSARRDAFDEYMKNLNKGINSAGLRNVDRPAFDKQLGDFQKFAMEHSEEIRKRQNGADIALMNKYQDVMNTVAESKGEEEKKKPLIEMSLDPNKRDRLNYDNVLESVHAHDQPLYLEDGSRNPNRKSLDISSIQFEPKPFEQDKYFKQFEDIKKSDLPPTITKDMKNLTQTTTTTSVFDKDAKDLIATRAVSDYMSNKSFKKFIDGLNPKTYNKEFNDAFGHPIENGGDLAAAYTLKGMQQKTVKSEMKDDILAREKAMAKLNHDYRMGEAAYRHSLGQSDGDTSDYWIDAHVQELKDKATKEGTKRIVNNYNGKEVKGVKVPLDPILSGILGFNEKNKGELMIGDDGFFYKLPYQTDDSYNPIKDKSGEGFKVDQTGINKISDSDLKLGFGKKTAGTTHTNAEMESRKPQTSPINYNGKTGTQTQLENAARASGYSLKEYKKLIGLE